MKSGILDYHLLIVLNVLGEVDDSWKSDLIKFQDAMMCHMFYLLVAFEYKMQITSANVEKKEFIMKNRVFVILLVVLLPIVSLSAEEISIKTSVDFTRSEFNLESVNLKFSNTVPDPQEIGYKVFDTVGDLTYDGGANGVRLAARLSGQDFIASNDVACYVYWQSYTNKKVNVTLSVDGPLKSTTSDSSINWKVILGNNPDDETKVADSSDVGSYSIDVVAIDVGTAGLTGACQFTIKTESLWQKPFESYSANMIAKIEAVE